MISGLVFDMDGVIFDTEKMLAHFWNKAALEFGYDMNISHSIAIRSTAPKKAEELPIMSGAAISLCFSIPVKNQLTGSIKAS